MSDIAIKMESVIKLEPEMMRLPDAFELLKEESPHEDSVLASSSDEGTTDTGSNLNVVARTPLPLTTSNEDSGHEGSPDDPATGETNKGIEELSKGGRGRASSLSTQTPDESDEVCIIEERICEGHWRNRKGHVARTCCSCHFMCSYCGTSILRRRDFLQHVQGHMAERQTDRWELHVKRSRLDRSVRPSLATETARKESAGRLPPQRVARLQSRTKAVVERRRSGRCRSVLLDDDGDPEIVEADVDSAPETPVPQPQNVTDDTLPNPPADQGAPKTNQLRELILLIERLPSHYLKNAGYKITRPAVSEKTSDQILGKKQTQSHKQTHAGRPSRKAHPKCGSACGNTDAVNKVLSKTRQSDARGRNLKKRKLEAAQNRKQVEVRKTGGAAPNKEVEESVSNPQLDKEKHAGSATMQKARTVECATAITEADKELLSKPNPQSQVQVDDGRLPLRKSQALENALNRAETIKMVSSKTPLQSHDQSNGSSSQKELAVKGHSRDIGASEKVLSKTPDQSNAHNASGKHTLPQGNKGNSAASSNSGIHENMWPRLLVRVEPEANLDFVKSQAKGNLKVAKTQGVSNMQAQSPALATGAECTIDKPQSPFSSNAEIRVAKTKLAKTKEVSKAQAHSPALANVAECTIDKPPSPFSSSAETGVAKTKEVSKTQAHSSALATVAECALDKPRSPFSSSAETRKKGHRARKSESEEISEGLVASVEKAAAQRQSQTQKLRAFRKPQSTGTVINQVTDGQASLNTRFQTRRRTLENHQLEQVVTEEHILQKPSDESCSLTNAGGHEKPLSQALLESDTLKRTFPDQTELVEGSGETKEDASNKTPLQFHAETVGVHATRKRRAGGTQNAELHKMADAKKRACLIPTTKSADISKNAADSDEVPTKTQRQSRTRSAFGSRKYQTCCNSMASISDSQAKLMGTTPESHMQPGTGDRMFIAQKSHVIEGKKEAADRLTLPRTRLQSHMQADGTFRCSYCKATFPDVDSLRPHVESHRYWEETFYCELCQRRFSTRGYLAIHMNAHQRGKPFACDLCDRRFALRSYLSMHMRGHARAAGEKPFGCSVCGARFVRVHWLNAHLRSHKGVRGRASAAAGGGSRSVKAQ